MKALRKYHSLMKIQPKERKTQPMLNLIEKSAVSLIFTKNQIDMYFDQQSGVYKIKTNIIGGKRNKDNKIIVF